MTNTADALYLDDHVFLLKPDPGLAITPAGAGAFLTAHSAQPSTRLLWRLGAMAEIRRFMACARDGAWWMVPRSGTSIAQVPGETQFLLVEQHDGHQVMIVPLLDHGMRFSVQGSPDGLVLVGETGDAFQGSQGGLAAYVARGLDPYVLMEQGAKAVAHRVPGCRLRVDKALPDFVDGLGWCTWDAFYHAVDPAGIRAGLTSLRAAGAAVRFLIIDDGWQPTVVQPTGEERLTSFRANGKFDHTLAPTVRMAKEEFNVERVLVWHNIVGYWGGMDPGDLPGYDARTVARSFGASLLQVQPLVNHPVWSQAVTRPEASGIRRFYHDYHQHLAGEGIDGVKVDSQAVIEGLANGSGGRVALTTAYRRALEDSVHRHFHGRLINCMSHGTETWYLSADSNLNRGSNDFWPNDPTSHGLHLWTNAAVGLWFGAFQHIDWDTFQTRHPQGWYHAAARAVSGSPVCVSDKPTLHDPAVLQAMAMSGGRIPRALDPGRPGRSSLYGDTPLLTIVNRNRHNAVVGVFHRHQAGDPASMTMSPAELPVPLDGEVIVYAHRARTVSRGQCLVTLAPHEWDILTLSPVEQGLAVIGLAGLLNAGGAITGVTWREGNCIIELADGGDLVGWAARRPTVVAGALPADLQWFAADGRFVLAVPASGRVMLSP